MNYLGLTLILFLKVIPAAANSECVNLTGEFKAEFENFYYTNVFKQTGCNTLNWKQTVQDAKGWESNLKIDGVWTQPGYEGHVHRYYFTSDSLVFESRHQHGRPCSGRRHCARGWRAVHRR